jgi:hypothetical protein
MSLKPELNGVWQPANQVNGKDSWVKGGYVLHFSWNVGGRWYLDKSYIASSAEFPPSGTWQTYYSGSWQDDFGVTVVSSKKEPEVVFRPHG